MNGLMLDGTAGAAGGGAGVPQIEVRARLTALAGAPPRARVTLCRSLSVSAGDASLGPRQLGGAKPRQIFIALLLQPQQALSKASLVRLLWDDAPPSGALSTLEGYVSLLRKRLDAVAPGLEDAVRTVPGGYLLDPAFLEVDVHRFRRLSARARASATQDALNIYAEAIDALTGTLLPDEDLDWIDQARRGLENELQRVLTEAATVALDLGDLDRAHRWARGAISLDALDEPAWRVVLECCERRGLYAEGLRAYDDCRRLLADELGCPPGPGVREVFGRLLESAKQVDEDPLAALVDAVVRLHLAVSSPAKPIGASAGREDEWYDGGTDVEDDWRLLERFLAVARSRRVAHSRISA